MTHKYLDAAFAAFFFAAAGFCFAVQANVAAATAIIMGVFSMLVVILEEKK